LIRKENGKPRELHGPWEDEAIKDDHVLSDACFAPDGKRFAVVTFVDIGNIEGYSDYRARIFSTIDGSELVPPLQLQRRGFDDVRAIFTRDGKQLITLSEDELRFWDLSTKSYPKKVLVQPHAQWVQVGQVGQKQIFVTLSGDGSGIVGDAKTRSQLQTLEPLHDIKDFTIRPVLSEDCRRLAAAFGNKIVIWDVDDGRLLSDPSPILFSRAAPY
jgi:WD40 repeat protein